MEASSRQSTELNRRPLASRSAGWARWIAVRLARSSVTPNQISVLSLVWATLGGALILWGNWWLMLVVAAICVQLRLLCNLMDGMVAIEGQKASSLGALFNEVPDRLADCLFLIPVGYAIGTPSVGWLLGLLAITTAYIRLLGGSLNLNQDFSGFMAKQRRMAALTVGLLAGAIEQSVWASHYALTAAALVVGGGSLWTCCTRLSRIATQLKAR